MINANMQVINNPLPITLTKKTNSKKSRQCKTMTFSKLFNQYRKWRLLQVDKSTVNNDVSIERNYFQSFENLLLVDVFNRQNMRNWYKKIIKLKEKSDLCKSIIVKKLRHILKFAYMHKYIRMSLYQDCDIILIPIKHTKKIKIERIAWSKQEQNCFLQACKSNYKDYVMFSLFVALGARIGEFLALMPKCLNLEKNRIEIKQQVKNISGTKKFNLCSKLKTVGSYRSIIINDELNQLLKDYLKRFKLKENDFLFYSFHKKQVMSRQTFRRKLIFYCNKANIRVINPHSIRHTLATRLASFCNNATDIEAAAKMLGHSPSMFLQTYASHNTEEAELNLCNKLWEK